MVDSIHEKRLFDTLAELTHIGHRVHQRVGVLLPDERARASQLSSLPLGPSTSAFAAHIARVEAAIMRASAAHESRQPTDDALHDLHHALVAAHTFMGSRSTLADSDVA